jgi:hypothetical protein
MSKIENAKITGTMLGIEGHGIMSSFIYLEFDGGGVGFGGYRLGGESGIAYIEEILNVVGVETWEQLKGKHVRVDSEGIGGKALGIGNIIKDKWLYHEEFFKRYE